MELFQNNLVNFYEIVGKKKVAPVDNASTYFGTTPNGFHPVENQLLWTELAVSNHKTFSLAECCG